MRKTRTLRSAQEATCDASERDLPYEAARAAL